MVRFKLTVNKDKETDYLNEMAEKGYSMTGFFAGFYSFEECRPGEYLYQVDISEGMFRVSNDYREFMQEMGVEIVCLWGMWVVLRKKAADGPFVLYTDVESSIEHYEKIRKMFKVVVCIEIICLIMELICVAGGTDWESVMLRLASSSILGALVVVLMREVARVNGILAQLRERIGQEDPGGFRGRGKISIFLSIGLLFNGIGYMIPETAIFYEPVRRGFQIAALIFIVAGMIATLRSRK